METVIDVEVVPSGSVNNGSGKGGTYLLVAGDSPEFDTALHFATRRVQVVDGRICLLCMMGTEGFVYWGAIENQMKAELRNQAELFIRSVAEKVYDLCGLMPSLYIEQGSQIDVITDILARDPGISCLVLGASSGGGGPGPLVSYFTGKGVSKLNVPLVIVPDHLTHEKIE